MYQNVNVPERNLFLKKLSIVSTKHCEIYNHNANQKLSLLNKKLAQNYVDMLNAYFMT